MRPKPLSVKKPAEQIFKDIRRPTRRHFSAEENIRILLDGLHNTSRHSANGPLLNVQNLALLPVSDAPASAPSQPH